MKNIKATDLSGLIANDTCAVQFSATWCAPCKGLTRTIEAHETSFDVSFYKIDIDDARELAQSLSIRSVPTLILFRKGQEINRCVGDKSLNQIRDFVNNPPTLE